MNQQAHGINLAVKCDLNLSVWFLTAREVVCCAHDGSAVRVARGEDIVMLTVHCVKGDLG